MIGVGNPNGGHSQIIALLAWCAVGAAGINAASENDTYNESPEGE